MVAAPPHRRRHRQGAAAAGGRPAGRRRGASSCWAACSSSRASSPSAPPGRCSWWRSARSCSGRASRGRRRRRSRSRTRPTSRRWRSSGIVKRSHRPVDFRGGSVTAVMGGVELDLRKANLTSTAYLDVVAFWGGIEIKVPAGWTVDARVVPLMGAFENKVDSPAASRRAAPGRARPRDHGRGGDRITERALRPARRAGAWPSTWRRRLPLALAGMGLLAQGRNALPPAAAALIAFPLSFAATLLLLPVWYLCRALPVYETSASAAPPHAPGGSAAHGRWPRPTSEARSRVSPLRRARARESRRLYQARSAGVMAAGALVYLLAVSLPLRAPRRGRHPARGAALDGAVDPGPRGGAAGAAGAGPSPLPLQQPELHQRARVHGSRCAPARCASCSPSSSARRSPSARSAE